MSKRDIFDDINIALALYFDYDACGEIFSKENEDLYKTTLSDGFILFSQLRYILLCIIRALENLVTQIRASSSQEKLTALPTDFFNISLRQDYGLDLSNYVRNHGNGFCLLNNQLFCQKFNWRFQKVLFADFETKDAHGKIRAGTTLDSLLTTLGSEKITEETLTSKFSTLPQANYEGLHGVNIPNYKIKLNILIRQIVYNDKLHQHSKIIIAVIDDDGNNKIFPELLNNLTRSFEKNKTNNYFLLALIKYNWLDFMNHLYAQKKISTEDYFNVQFLKIPSKLTEDQLQHLTADDSIQTEIQAIVTNLINNMDTTKPLTKDQIIEAPIATAGSPIDKCIKIMKALADVRFAKEEEKMEQAQGPKKTLTQSMQSSVSTFKPAPPTKVTPDKDQSMDDEENDIDYLSQYQNV